MRSTSKVILAQLENEGVYYHILMGAHLFNLGETLADKAIACQRSFSETVDQALKHSIRVVGLLAKLQDSISEDSGDPREIETKPYHAHERSQHDV